MCMDVVLSFSENGVILADNSLSALLYDEDDNRRVALHQFNQHVKNDDCVEKVVLTMREGITTISPENIHDVINLLRKHENINSVFLPWFRPLED